jgi:hypothetical protein
MSISEVRPATAFADTTVAPRGTWSGSGPYPFSCAARAAFIFKRAAAFSRAWFSPYTFSHTTRGSPLPSRGGVFAFEETATSPSRRWRLHLQGARLHLQGDGDFAFKRAATSPSRGGDLTFKGTTTSPSGGGDFTFKGRRLHLQGAADFTCARFGLRGQGVVFTFKGAADDSRTRFRPLH